MEQEQLGTKSNPRTPSSSNSGDAIIKGLQNAAAQAARVDDPAQLFQQYDVDGTPFKITKMEDKGWFVNLGKYRLSPPYKNMETAWEDAKHMSWDRIMQVVQVMINENLPKEKKISPRSK